MIHAVMISCDIRKDIRNETINDLHSTDWRWPLTIVMDKDYFDPEIYPTIPKTERQTVAAYNGLKIAVSYNTQWIVFMEDDLIFNKYIAHNILSWDPIKYNYLNFGSLYTPANNRCAQEERQFFYIADCLRLYGSQFYIMSTQAAQWAIEHWNSIEGMQDIKLTRLARGKPILYHSPSLVDHRDVGSVWGGMAHHAHDFDLNWRNPYEI
jgi:hypothetical protein